MVYEIYVMDNHVWAQVKRDLIIKYVPDDVCDPNWSAIDGMMVIEHGLANCKEFYNRADREYCSDFDYFIIDNKKFTQFLLKYG